MGEKGVYRGTTLYEAVFYNNLEVAKYLIANETNVN